MKFLASIFILFLTLFILTSNSKNKPVSAPPHQKTRLNIVSELDAVIRTNKNYIQRFSTLSQTQKENEFNQLKEQFKKSEFLIQFIDPAFHNRYLNGAPLPKIMKGVPDLTIVQPTGLQHIEELVYNQEETTEIQKELSLFLKKLQKSKQYLQKLKLSDSEVFEAMRFGIITINALGITGFDSPSNPNKSLKETAQFLNGIKLTFDTYSSYIDSAQFSNISSNFKQSITLLKQANFNSFDRLNFLTTYLNPLYKDLLGVQKKLQIELPHQRSFLVKPVNYSAENLYDEDFLNESYFLKSIFKGDKAAQINLGKTLFYDPILSSSNDRACASCHNPKKGFTDGLSKSLETKSMKAGQRNAPALGNAIYSEKFFHDMRAEDLFQQIDHVVLNDKEFATSYKEMIQKLAQSDEYVTLFEKAYLSKTINKDKIKNALIYYLSSLKINNSAFDLYVRGEIPSISEEVKKGYNLFTGKAACATCHFAPTFSGLTPPFFAESESEVLGVPLTKENRELDQDIGRRGNGKAREYVDFYKHSFKTPSLRNIALSAPYMHNGVYNTLEEVLDFYNKGGGAGLGYQVLHQTLPQEELNLNDTEISQIVLFMKALTDSSHFNDAPKHLPSFKNEKLNNRIIGGKY